ncbi:hypothetical protein BJF93_21380 [Xaviernesmea oryzae]|uniref:AsmA domain-containing protein n=1 Tax=Xaviernesmea oryzae TaxID=464029 RepID=A0A1Q9B021_9HYPH|nr:AsmA family protein [Xaviernesmea oryzae]OLP61327.1 hypothetical protein BJF93_21380 [Xaviernesmea oryzae]SEL55232.1 AsmA family protein [Xaviernesmea oryzae]
MLSRIFVVVGGLLVVALFGALIAPLFIDWTNFRQDFEREATRIIGQPVTVHGSVDARLIPFPSVTLNDVRIGRGEDGAPLVTVAHFAMDAELAPFLSGEALIFDMRLDQPKAKLKLLPDGTLDWARGRQASIPAKSVVLENVSVTGGEVEFIDEQTGRTRHVTGLDADLSARTLAGPWQVEGRGALDGEAGRFSLSSGEPDDEGALPLRARLTPDKRPFGVDLDGILKIVDFRPLYQGRFTLTENRGQQAQPVSSQDVQAPRINGTFELTNERIRVPDYRLEVGPRDDPYLVTGEATLDTGKVPQFLLLANGQQIDVSRIGNRGEAGKTNRNPEVSVRQRLQAMLALLADIPIPQVPGKANLRLPAIVIGDTTVRDVRLDLRPDRAGWMVDNAVAQLPGRTQLEAKGRLTLVGQRAFRGDLLIASTQPSGLASWLAGSVDPALRRLPTAGFSATVNLTDSLQQFERLEIAAGPATLRGRIERQSLPDAPPTLTVQLKGNRVDLDALRALTGLAAGDTSSETVLAHTIAADISAEEFEAFGETARDVQLVATLKNGQLQAERVSIGDLAGAQLALSGRMSGQFSNPAVAAKMKIAAEDLTPLLQLIARHAPAHPAFERLVRAGPYYANAALDFTLTSGAKDGAATANFGMVGTANGSRLAVNYQAPDLQKALSGEGLLLEATIENPSSLVVLGQTGFDPLPFDPDGNGLMSLKLQETDGSEAAAALNLTTQNTTLALTGDVDLAAADFLAGQGKLVLESRDLEPLLLLQGVSLPQMGTGLPAQAKADIAVTREKVTLANLQGQAAGDGFSGTLTLDRMTPGKAEGQIAVDTISLPWMAEGILGPLTDPAAEQLSDARLPPAPWTGLDMRLGVTAKQFWPGLYGAVGNFAGTLAWRGDQLDMTDAKGDWLGGKATGQMRLGSNGGSGFLEGKLSIANGDLGQAVWQRQGQPVARGTGDFAVTFNASGASPRAMAQSLTGSGTLALKDTVLKGIRTDVFPDLLAAADGQQGELTPARTAALAAPLVFAGEAKLGNVTIPFTIAGGTLRAQEIAAGDAGALVAGDLELQLPEDRIAGALTLTYKAGEAALAGAEPAVIVQVAGRLQDPGISVDYGPISGYLSLRAFERERRRVETLQANVLEKQRLRREAGLARAQVEAREAERLRLEEEDRRRRAAAAEAARLRAEQARAAEEARRQAEAAAQAAAAARQAREAAEAARRAREAAPPAAGSTPATPQNPAGGNQPNLDFQSLPGLRAP